MNIAFITFLIVWSLGVIQRSLYQLYLWQVKEYRWDRMHAFLKTGPGKQFFLDKLTGLKLAFFLIGLVAINYLGLYYLALFIPYVLHLILLLSRRSKVKKPDFTKKALLIYSLTFLSLAAPTSLILFTPNLNIKILSLLGLDLLLPAIIPLAILVQWPLGTYLKNKTFKRAAEKRAKHKKLTVIGITGSYGKSSVKEFLATLLKEKFKVLKTPQNVNSEMGIANFILAKLKKNHQVLVAEMGAYKKGEIKKSCEIVRPQIGILTAINEQHLDLFGGLENTKKAKYELISSLPHNGFAVFNGDNEHTFKMALKTQVPHVLYSVKDKAHVWASDIKATLDYLRFVLNYKDKKELIEVKLTGKHNVSNLLAAITVSLHLGLDMEELRRGLSKLEPLERTLRPIIGREGVLIIDDSYSANPDGVIAALEYLKENFTDKQKVILMPSLIELGREARAIHAKLGSKLAEIGDQVIITTADYYKEILQGVERESYPKFRLIMKSKEIKQHLKGFLDKDTVVLLESRVPGEVIKYLKY